MTKVLNLISLVVVWSLNLGVFILFLLAWAAIIFACAALAPVFLIAWALDRTSKNPKSVKVQT